MPLPRHPNLSSPYDSYLDQGRWDQYIDELQHQGLLWLIRMDMPRLVYHLMPLNSRPDGLALPLRLEFLREIIEPTVALDRVEHYLYLFERQHDHEAAYAAATAGIGLIFNQGNDFSQFGPWYERIEAMLAQDADVSVVFTSALMMAKGNVELHRRFNFPAARRSFTEALQWAEASGDAAVNLAVASTLGYFLIHAAEFQRLAVLLADTAPLIGMPEVPFEAVVAFNGLWAMVKGLTGAVDEATQLLAEIVDDPNFNCVSPGTWLMVQGNLMYNSVQIGDQEQAAQIANGMREFAIPEGNHFFHAYTQFNLALETNVNGDWGMTRVYLEEGIRRLQLVGSGHNENMTRLMLIQVLLETGETEKALELADELKSQSTEKKNYYVAAGVELELAHLHVEQHKLAKARVHYDRARDIYGGLDPIHPTRLRSFERSLKRILYPDIAVPSSNDALRVFPVRITTLGGLKIQYQDISIDGRTWRGRQTKALLLALVVFGGSVSGEKLMDLLWPDAEGDKAGQNLKATIHRLRQMLKSDGQGAPPWITVHDGRVGLNRDMCSVDALLFATALSQALETKDDRAKLQETLDLYPDEFMPHNDAEPFIIAHRRGLRWKYVKGVLALARHCLEGDDPDAALPYLEAAAKYDPTNDGICELAMELHLRMGRSSAALKSYEQTRDALSQEMSLEPGEALRALVKQAHQT